MVTHLKKTYIAAERDEVKRANFLNDIASIMHCPENWVFIDESFFQENMVRRYARSLSSERAIDHVPVKRGKNQTFISAIQLSGVKAEFIVEGGMTGDFFEWYVENELCPTLTPGKTVFLDNLPTHHRGEAIDLIEDCGCHVIFLPPYSPDLNPIEMLFSKLKALIRAGRWKTVQELWIALGKALEAVTTADIAGWFKACYSALLLWKML